MSIEVLNESGNTDVDEKQLSTVAEFALATMDVHPSVEVTITCVDLDTIKDLHVRWLDLEGPTDVMSFPMDDISSTGGRPDAADPGPAYLGDIILCPDFAQKQADKAGHSLNHELDLLTVHGCLHLLGYDHAKPNEEQHMFALQNDILKRWYEATGREKPTTPKAFPSAAEKENL